jgi:glycosyltransferase involved in cell wall biosynthesis
MRKVRVLYLLSTLERSGPTNVVYNIIKYLDKSAVEPIVLTLSAEPVRSRKSDFQDLGISVRSFEKNRLYWLTSSMKGLKQLASDLAPDIIHSHSYRADVSSAKHFGGYKRIGTIHGDLHANYRNTYNRLLGDWLASRQLKSLRGLEKAVACSEAVFGLYKNTFRALECIPNGVDMAVFRPSDKAKARESLQLPIDKTIYISVGSLCNRKDPGTVIEGFCKSQSYKTSLLILIGDGELAGSVRSKYKDHENILFAGFHKNVSQYMQASDYFISASLSEGLPNTVLEAMACGLPVCLSSIPSHLEILEKNKLAGTEFTPRDPEKLALSLDTLAEEKQRSRSEAALDVIGNHYNAEAMAKSYEQLYKTLVTDERS